jgi:lipopolysaccharide export system protein LptC
MTVAPTESAAVDSEPFQPEQADLWRWLVLLAVAALWLEWWLYYATRERQRTAEIKELPDDFSLHVDRNLHEPEESGSRDRNLVI